MDEVRGSMGTSAGFALRLGQTIFSFAALLFMSLDDQFYTYTPLCFLVNTMGLVIPWSFILALLDGYSILFTHSLREKGFLFIMLIGDWVLLTLTLAAASSAAAVVDTLLRADASSIIYISYLLSIIFAFLAWFLSMTSFLFNLWLLPSL